MNYTLIEKNEQKEYMEYLCVHNLPELELKYFAL